MGINRIFGVSWGYSGGGNIQKIHQGIDPDKRKCSKIRFLKNAVFRYFLTFGLYFDLFWHYHHTRFEKLPILVFFSRYMDGVEARIAQNNSLSRLQSS